MTKRIKPAFAAACLMLVLIPVTYFFNHNTYMLNWKKSDLVQYKFAEIINETPNATLLNYGGLDFGFFTAANITPNIRFFEKQNIPYERFPQNLDEHNKYIMGKEIDYIVFRLDVDEDIATLNVPFLKDNYTLVSTSKQKYEDEEFIYALFKLKDSRLTRDG
ncbi:MAG: hypothetical protein ACOYU3_08850 [Bacillota bacterium]